MALYRTNERLDVDDRILVAQDMEEFALWRERAQLGFHGIICRYTEDLQTLRETALQIAEALRYEHSTYFVRFTDKDDYMRWELGLRGISQQGINIITRLSNLFHAHVLTNSMEGSRTQLRINSNFPSDFHAHNDTLSFAFTQIGSVCRSPEGIEYPINAGRVILFDEDIEHRAQRKSAKWVSDPRVNLVI